MASVDSSGNGRADTEINDFGRSRADVLATGPPGRLLDSPALPRSMRVLSLRKASNNGERR